MKIQPVTATLAAPSAPRGTPAHRVDEEQFAHDLSLMLRSGLGLLEGLRTLAEQRAGSAGEPMRQLLQRLQQGENLSRAMQATGAFGVQLVACARASELTGDLGDALQRFAANAGRLRELRTRIVSACIYPALLVAVSGCVVLFLLAYVVPRFAIVLDNAAQDLSPMTRALIAVGRLLHDIQLPLWLGLAAAGIAAGVFAWRQRRAGRLTPWLLGAAARLPWMRTYVRSYGLSQLTRSTAMLMRSGVPALRALGMCRDLLPDADRQALDAALRSASAGAPLAQSLHACGLLDTLGWRVLRVSEDTGQLHAAMDRLADVHDTLLSRGLERLGRMVEPLLMLAIGAVVGGIVVLMYVPIFQMASSLR
jgi:general secretion pathway protein F